MSTKLARCDLLYHFTPASDENGDSGYLSVRECKLSGDSGKAHILFHLFANSHELNSLYMAIQVI